MLDFIGYVVIRNPQEVSAGSNQPTVIHPSKVCAEREAIRLATVNRGTAFYLASLIGYAVFPEPEASFIDLTEAPSEDDVPF